MIHSKKECTTRRTFCKRMAGVTLTGAFVGLEAMAAPEAKAEGEVIGNGEQLVAVCGTYCGACPMYINNKPIDKQKTKEMFERYAGGPMNMNLDKMVCDGCLSTGYIAPHCKNCKMRLCAIEKPDVTRCSDCPDYPCPRVQAFTSDGKRHHAELPDNLRNLKQRGINEWTRHEQERWTCPQCSSPLSWYDPACSKCGAKRSDKLFLLG